MVLNALGQTSGILYSMDAAAENRTPVSHVTGGDTSHYYGGVLTADINDVESLFLNLQNISKMPINYVEDTYRNITILHSSR